MQPKPLLPITYWSVEKGAQGSTKLMLLCRNYHCLASISQPFCSTTCFPTQHRGKGRFTPAAAQESANSIPQGKELYDPTFLNTTQVVLSASSQQRCCGTGRTGTTDKSQVMQWFSIVLRKLIEPCLTEGVRAHSAPTSDCTANGSSPSPQNWTCVPRLKHSIERRSHELWCTLTGQKETKSLSFWILLLCFLKMTATKMECAVTFLSTYLKP